ncbi:VCBS repeat-containing protein [Fodinibius sediminis]|uniref:VCBS repeat-containing protein n=1 Tax=Fodinibius sediminis TaxID=1214077 RepID=UPI003D9C86C6
MGGNSRDTLFEKVPSSSSHITFSNHLNPTNAFNIYTYANFYSGGGVGLGDFNNDGLIDIYLVANQEDNKLYLNEGDFSFRDITEEAGVGGTRAWSTGVSIADVNGDGMLDIYVSNAGNLPNDDRKNELFINNGDLTFSERAEEYGLADSGYSIHASFFDYDKDGDLDMYLLNYTPQSIGSFDLQRSQRDVINFKGGDRFYRNDLIQADSTGAEDQPSRSDKHPTFTNVTRETGIFSSDIGFGLGVSVGDVNRDGWEDIFISNDFFERDYLYINNKDGTFRETLEQQMNSISTTSMGGDIADLNHDGFPEIFVTDMLPESEERLKTITTFADWEQYQFELQHNYFHQMTRNVLQLNNGNDTFSEIGRYAGVEATAWSWGALISDFNLDGENDIFVPNGVYKDMTDQDHLLHVSQQEVINSVVQNNRVNYKKLIDMTPSNPTANYLFENQGSLQFRNRAEAWGLDEPSFSNGAAYGDLDNDGDMDLVVNNVNAEPFVYRNRTTEKHSQRHWLRVALQGPYPNSRAVGSQLLAIANGRRWYAEQMPVRGYQSTVDSRIHIGLGPTSQIDTLWVRWPDGQLSRKLNIEANQTLTFSHEQARADTSWTALWQTQSQPSLTDAPPLLQDVTDSFPVDWKHTEDDYLDFSHQPLLYHSKSTEGPPLCTGDVNEDGQQDFFAGGAKGQPGTLFLQEGTTGFTTASSKVFAAASASEDVDCAFFDADGNGTLDLYVASGGGASTTGDPAFSDRLYLNNGEGQFTLSREAFSSLGSWFNAPTGVVEAADFNSDGTIDLFVGHRMQPAAYGIPASGYLLQNNGDGTFTDVTSKRAPALSDLGLLTDAQWGDVDGDGDPDLLVAGEWMPVTLFKNERKFFEDATAEAGLDSTHGWWNTLKLRDLDGDGDLDWLGGNHGLNSRFRATAEQPVELWVNDYNQDGSFEQILTTFKGTDAYPVALRHDLMAVLPMLNNKAPNYHSYAGKTVHELFNQKQLDESIHLQATMLGSSIGWNDGTGHFQVERLPKEAQLSPIYGIHLQDLDGDKRLDILLGGNLQTVKPQAGPYDASYGTLLKQDSSGQYRAIPPQQSGLSAEGEIRSIRSLQHAGQTYLLIARNNRGFKVYKLGK